MMLPTNFGQRLKQTPLYQTRFYKRWLHPLQKKLLAYFQHSVLPQVVNDVQALAIARNWLYQPSQSATIQTCRPSLALSEDVLDIIQNGQQRVQEHHETQQSQKTSRGEMYYSHLYAFTRYPLAETFTCEIPQAIIADKSGMVLTPTFELLNQSTFRRNIQPKPIVTKGLSYQIPYLPGTYVSLLASSTTYAHWLMDCLPRLSLLDLQNPHLKGFGKKTLGGVSTSISGFIRL